MSVCKDSNVEVSYGIRKNFFDVPVNSVHRFRPEGLVGECIIGIDADCFRWKSIRTLSSRHVPILTLPGIYVWKKACSRSRTACSTSCEKTEPTPASRNNMDKYSFSCPMVKYRTKYIKKSEKFITSHSLVSI